MIISTQALIVLSFMQSFGCHTVRAFTRVSPPRLFHRGSFPPATMPSADFSHEIRAGCPNPQPISPARGGPGHHGRSPGVNTCLSAHERRVYLPGLRWIEDLTLCCGLVPPGPPNSVLVHRPMRLRHPASAGQLPPRAPSPRPSCHTATSFSSTRMDQGLVLDLVFTRC